MPPKKVVLSGYYGYGNFGDEAILSTLVSRLKMLNADITVLSGNPRLTGINHIVSTVKNFDIPKVIERIHNSDLLISGGGSLLQDVTSLKSLLYYAFVIAIALFYKKEVIIFAQGIGPIKNRFARMIVQKLLKKCSYISVRDENSWELLNSWGIEADLVCDPIYSFPVEKNFTDNTVGVQLRGFKTLSDTLLNKLARYLVKYFYNKKIEIISFQDAVDYPACHKLAEIIKNINPKLNIEVVSGLSNNMLIERLSRLEYLIAMRFHAILLAMKFGIKTVAINYDIKVDKIASEFNLPKITMTADGDFDTVFTDLSKLNPQDLVNIAASKRFDWRHFDEIITK